MMNWGLGGVSTAWKRTAAALTTLSVLSACSTVVPPSANAPSRSTRTAEQPRVQPRPQPQQQQQARTQPRPQPQPRQPQARPQPPRQQQQARVQPRPAPQVATPRPPVSTPAARPPERVAQAPQSLQQAIRMLGSGFDGQVGIAVRDVHAGWVVEWNGTTPMPQQSVSKLWVASTLLDQVDQGRRSLSDTTLITPGDLTLFHQPIRQFVGKDGYRASLSSLLERAMTQSDNTANDTLLRTVGGPTAVRDFFARKQINGIRFGPGERLLQSGIAGMSWKQEYSVGNAFYTARANLPMTTRQAALDRYLADPMDGATAIGMVEALAKLKRGELLSPRSTDYLITTMQASRTGPRRLRGGVAPGWMFGHKTGTGQELSGRATGYNDVGLLTAPDGRSYAVAVLIGATRRPIIERMQLMQAVSRAVVASHQVPGMVAD